MVVVLCRHKLYPERSNTKKTPNAGGQILEIIVETINISPVQR